MLKKIVKTSLAVMKEYELSKSGILFIIIQIVCHLSYISYLSHSPTSKDFHRQDHQENGPLKLNPVLSNPVEPATISNPWMNPAQ